MAKAGLWATTDAEKRKRGERTGLDTLVVHAVNVWELGVGLIPRDPCRS
jgi:hypothetical protein